MHLGETIVTALAWYFRIGGVVAILFALVVGRVVPSARGGSIPFRLMILPGAVMLWPYVLYRSARALASPPPKDGHA